MRKKRVCQELGNPWENFFFRLAPFVNLGYLQTDI